MENREEVLAELQPEAKQKEPKVKKNPSLAFKASLKSKPSAKNMPSAKHNTKEKGLQKKNLQTMP